MRLGNPLNCSLNDITVEDLNKLFVDGAYSKSADNNGEVPLANEKATDENEGLELLIRLHLMEVPSL